MNDTLYECPAECERCGHNLYVTKSSVEKHTFRGAVRRAGWSVGIGWTKDGNVWGDIYFCPECSDTVEEMARTASQG